MCKIFNAHFIAKGFLFPPFVQPALLFMSVLFLCFEVRTQLVNNTRGEFSLSLCMWASSGKLFAQSIPPLVVLSVSTFWSILNAKLLHFHSVPDETKNENPTGDQHLHKHIYTLGDNQINSCVSLCRSKDLQFMQHTKAWDHRKSLLLWTRLHSLSLFSVT